MAVAGNVVGFEQPRAPEARRQREDPLARIGIPRLDAAIPRVLPALVEIDEESEPPVHRQAAMPVAIDVQLQVSAAADRMDAVAAQFRIGRQVCDAGDPR